MNTLRDDHTTRPHHYIDASLKAMPAIPVHVMDFSKADLFYANFVVQRVQIWMLELQA